MLRVLFITLILFIPQSAAFAITISTKCVSQNGMSTYDLTLNLTNRKGLIRFKFMGQDVDYKAHIVNVNDTELEGIAVFHRSRTGETKGNPFNFRYNFKENTLYELKVAAKCN